MPELFGHLFSSYTWKALIAFYENETAFEFRTIDAEHPDNFKRLEQCSPQRKFPLLIEGDTMLFESSVIIEYLQRNYPGAAIFIPADFDKALEVRMLDRFFDNYVMTPMQNIVADFMRRPEDRDVTTVEQAKAMLQRSYAWLDGRLKDRQFACGDSFSLADCAAAPSLFYADWVMDIPTTFTTLRAYRARLLERPTVKRCVDEARPYRKLFPPGAPERD